MKILKFKSLLIIVILFLTLSVKADVNYYYIINVNNVALKSNSDNSEIVIKSPFLYAENFDLSKVGIGDYTNNNKTVFLPSGGVDSKPTFSLYNKDTDEARFKFRFEDDNYGFGSHVKIVDSYSNQVLFRWLNNRSLLVLNSTGTYTTVFNEVRTDISTLEFRFNFKNKNYMFLINGINVYSEYYNLPYPDDLHLLYSRNASYSPILHLL